MSRSRLLATVLGMLVIASLACSAATSTPTSVPAPTQAPPTKTVARTSAPTIAPAATNTRAPTLRPTTASLPSGVLFSDDFSSQKVSEDKGWVFDTGDNVDYGWSAGQLTISIKKKQWLGLDWPDGAYDDFGAEVEAQAVGSDYAEYGIVLRVSGDQDTRTYYIFGVSTDGKYYLQKKVRGQWADQDPVPAAASQYIKPKAKNTLAVLAQGNKLYLYINGFMVKSLTDDSSASGFVGVYGSTGENDSAQVSFNRLTILTADKAKADWGTTPAAGGAGTQPTATARPSGGGTGNGIIAVRNTFPGACQANLFGKQEAVVRAEGHSTASKSLPPGTYGVHLAVDIGEVDMPQFYLPPGGYCQLTCDAASRSVYNSCR
jgi:hypothetical protein